jgi:hypothetical protein
VSKVLIERSVVEQALVSLDKQALQALERLSGMRLLMKSSDHYGSDQLEAARVRYEDAQSARAALQAALDSSAADPVGQPAGEQTGPVSAAPTLLEALEAAKEALPKMNERETIWCTIQGHHLRVMHDALRTALEQSGPEKPRTGCEAKRKNGGVCPYHNLQCGWPACEGKQ